MTEATVQTKTRTITVSVNNKPVHLPDDPGRDEATGLEIKQAAIAQGINIQIDFSLFELRGNDLQPVGDNDQIHVRNNQKFRAVAPDDTSNA